MDEKERHIRENEAHRHDDVTSDVIADKLRAEGKNNQRNSTRNINKLWLWLGVLILIVILLWFLFTYVIAFDVAGDENGSLIMQQLDNLKLMV
ncbi:MAG: hypothetical protein J1F07_07340 [Muribaculaceae bacterium]|nr:hypothetical protein [Muribaculaceae bacterium]